GKNRAERRHRISGTGRPKSRGRGAPRTPPKTLEGHRSIRERARRLAEHGAGRSVTQADANERAGAGVSSASGSSARPEDGELRPIPHDVDRGIGMHAVLVRSRTNGLTPARRDPRRELTRWRRGPIHRTTLPA